MKALREQSRNGIVTGKPGGVLRVATLLSTALAMTGCRSSLPGKANAPATGPTTAPAMSYVVTTEIKPLDPRQAIPAMFQVEVYQILLPIGSISRNEEFWKRVDEYAVDVATHDLLLKNGVRVGLLHERDMQPIKRLIEQNPTQVQRSTLIGHGAKDAELEMNREVDFQNIFFFSPDNQVSGRTFENCTNAVTFSFEPAIRSVNTLRVSFCPTVRAVRRRLEFTAMNQEVEKYNAITDRLYDMNLRADLPSDCALIVAPSAESSRESSVGHAFFTRPGSAERQEYLLMVIARPMQEGRVRTTVK